MEEDEVPQRDREMLAKAKEVIEEVTWSLEHAVTVIKEITTTNQMLVSLRMDDYLERRRAWRAPTMYVLSGVLLGGGLVGFIDSVRRIMHLW